MTQSIDVGAAASEINKWKIKYPLIFEDLDVSASHSRLQFKLTTEIRTYVISVRPPSVIDTSHYVGCIMQNRYPLEGEDWLRGADLPDGEMIMKTLKAIITRIISIETSKI